MNDRMRSKREEREYTRLLASLREQEACWEEPRYKKKTIPPQWYGLHNTAPCVPKKVRVTAGYDEDVVKFFRALGQGYQARMNTVLRSYMHAVLAKEIESPDDRNSRGDPIWPRNAARARDPLQQSPRAENPLDAPADLC